MHDGSRALILTPPQPPYYAAPQENSWHALWRVFSQRKGVMISVCLAVVGIGSAASLLRPASYEAASIIMISPQKGELSSQGVASAETALDDETINTHVELLNSRALAGRVVNSLNLVADPYWNSNARVRRGEFTPTQAAAERTAVIDRVRSALSAEREGDTYMVTITATTARRQDAARLANAAADQYADLQRETGSARLDRSLDWLSQRTDQLREEVAEKEAAVETYRGEAGLLSSNGMTLAEQQISEIQGAVMSARADLAEREARLAELNRLRQEGAPIETLASAIGSGTIGELRARDADIARRQADMEERYSERHPALRGIRQERESLRSEIGAEVARIAANAENEVNITRHRLASLQASLSETSGRMTGENREMMQLHQIEREATAARQVYEGFLERRHALAEQSELFGSAAEIVSQAEPPTAPQSKHLLLTILFALGAGAALGVLAALAADYFDPRVTTSDDAERITGAPVLSASPLLLPRDMRDLSEDQRHPAGYLAAHPVSAFTESYRLLRATAVRGEDATVGAHIVAITSPLPGDGKTTTSLCLARVAGLAKTSTIIIDCDLRRRSLNHLLGIEPERGLQHVLLGEIDWRDLVGVDEFSGAHILPAASGQKVPVDLLSRHVLSALLKDIAQTYGLIVLDCPPILALAETREMLRCADATVIVARSGKTNAPALAAAVRQARSAGGQVAGIMLNGVRPSRFRQACYADPLYFTPSMKSFYSA